MKNCIYFLLLLAAGLFASCDADFDPNDDWQEQMMVYCLLDQDDDTTYVRVEKCFLGQGNALEFAKNKDSVYYAPDELDVKIYAYNRWDTSQLEKVFDFNYSEIYKAYGEFYSDTECPVYYCVTKNELTTNHYYKLVIINNKTGKTVTSSSYLIMDYSIQMNNMWFSGREMDENKRLEIKWTNFNGTADNQNIIPKQYQINVRLNYLKEGAIRSIDIPVGKKLNNNTVTSTTLSSYTTIGTIVSGIRLQLQNEHDLRLYEAQPFEIRISACGLSLFDYVSINNSTQNVLNYQPVYSNIEGGFGIFAARRQNIKRVFSGKELDTDLLLAIGENVPAFGSGY